MAETRLDPNLVALLMNRIQNRVGMGGQQMMPQFTGGGGMDPNLGALLVAGGQIPKRLDMQGRVMLPGAQQGGAGGLDGQTFEGLDALHSNQPRGIPGTAMTPDGHAFGRVGADRVQHWEADGALGGGLQGPSRSLRNTEMVPNARDMAPGGGAAPYVPPTQTQTTAPAPSGPDYQSMYQPMAGGADLYARLAADMRKPAPQAPMPTFEPPTGQAPQPEMPTHGYGFAITQPKADTMQFPQSQFAPPSQMPMGGAGVGAAFGQQQQLEQGIRDRFNLDNKVRAMGPSLVSPFLNKMEEKSKRPLGNPRDLFPRLIGGAKSAKGRKY